MSRSLTVNKEARNKIIKYFSLPKLLKIEKLDKIRRKIE